MDSTQPDESKVEQTNTEDKQEHIQQRLKELGVSDDSKRPEKSWVARYGNYLMISVILTLVVIYWLEYRTIDNTNNHAAEMSAPVSQQPSNSYGVPYAVQQPTTNYSQPLTREQWMEQQEKRRVAMQQAWQEQQARQQEWQKNQYEQRMKAWQDWQNYIKTQQDSYQSNQNGNNAKNVQPNNNAFNPHRNMQGYNVPRYYGPQYGRPNNFQQPYNQPNPYVNR